MEYYQANANSLPAPLVAALSPAALPEFAPAAMGPNAGPLAMLAPATLEAPSQPPDLPEDDMDLLERILRECHLSDAAAQPPGAEPSVEALERGFRECHLGNAAQPSGAAPSAPSGAAPPPAAAPTGPADFTMWADEMVQRLQTCACPEDAKRQCAEMLAIFHREKCGGSAEAERMQKLQGANRVLLRGFRNLYRRLQELDARRKRAEEACARTAAELARCQEALHTSERAKATLQYHLTLMKSVRHPEKSTQPTICVAAATLQPESGRGFPVNRTLAGRSLLDFSCPEQ